MFHQTAQTPSEPDVLICSSSIQKKYFHPKTPRRLSSHHHPSGDFLTLGHLKFNPATRRRKARWSCGHRSLSQTCNTAPARNKPALGLLGVPVIPVSPLFPEPSNQFLVALRSGHSRSQLCCSTSCSLFFKPPRKILQGPLKRPGASSTSLALGSAVKVIRELEPEL